MSLVPKGSERPLCCSGVKAEATALGYTCLTVSGFRQESNHPNGALTRLLSATLTDESLDDLVDPYDAAILKSVLPGIRDPAIGVDEPVTQIESLRALHAVLTVIGELGSGLVILVDNIEFVDEMTLAAPVLRCCRRGIGAPLLIVAATRVGTLRHELAPSVSTRIAIALTPLDRNELARLVVDIPTPAQEQLLDVADGNAFYAIELAAHHRRGLISNYCRPIASSCPRCRYLLQTRFSMRSLPCPKPLSPYFAQPQSAEGTDSRRGLRSSWLRSMKVKDSLPLDQLVGTVARSNRHMQACFRHPGRIRHLRVHCPRHSEIDLHQRAVG